MKVETRFTRTLAALRGICLSFPESSEKLAWGHPTFRAGKKIFCSLGVYDGEVCFGFKPDEATYRTLIEDPRCFVPAYVGHLGWLSMRVTDKLDLAEARGLCEQSYRQFALVRMLKALEAEPQAGAARTPRKPRVSRKP